MKYLVMRHGVPSDCLGSLSSDIIPSRASPWAPYSGRVLVFKVFGQ